MQDYTKFKLKSDTQLSLLLEDKNNLLVLSCNKCFKLFDTKSETPPELEYFVDFARKHNKKILDSHRIDFLCNVYRLKELLDNIPEKYTAIIVIACGIGVQTVGSCTAIPVYTACNTIKDTGSHGMSLSEKLCDSCGQCFLNATNSICPITQCFKQLLNGPCGGSKNGKCEVDKDKDCIWDSINTRLADTLSGKYAPMLYKHSNINKFETQITASSVQRKREESFYGGLYLKHCKDFSAFLTLKSLQLPEKVIIPMSQHAGMSADPIVKVGDHVKVGQKIGEAVGTLSSSVHASVSGKITCISNKTASHGHENVSNESNDSISELNNSLCITIESDGKDELHQSVIPIPYWEDLDIYDIDAIIAEKGIVGMGGAGFPTPVKLKAPKPIDTILLNGCESEPYITADHRIMLEYADDIIKGLQIMLKCTNAKRGIIVISDNKSDCIHHLETKTTDIDDIFVMALWSKYPQGAERMLIARTLGRGLKYGQRPYDAGAIVINVSTARAIGDAFTRGMPLIERAVTVSGENVRNPQNLMVRIGTPVSVLLNNACAASDCEVILGGPMMGKVLDCYDVPIIKGTNAVIAMPRRFTQSNDCIRCGRCVDVCPMELLPLNYPVLEKGAKWNEMRENNVAYCIECACCDYICPSMIKITDAVRKGKRNL